MLLQAHKFLMGSQLHNAAVANDSYFICIMNGGESVRDDDACAAFTSSVKCLLHDLQVKVKTTNTVAEQ